MNCKSHRKCEICGKQEIRADHTQGPIFYSKFPLDENRCREWVRAIGNQDLVYLPIEKLHQLRHVCGEHFDKKDWNKKGNRLKKDAVPTLKLPALPLSSEQLQEFPLHMKRTVNVAQPPVDLPTTSRAPPLYSEQRHEFPLDMVQTVNVAQPPVDLPTTSHAPPLYSEQLHEFPLDMVQTVNVAQPPVDLPTTSRAPPLYSEQLHEFPLDMMQTVNASVSLADLPSTSGQQRKRKAQNNLELSPRKKKLIEKLKQTQCKLRSLQKSAMLVEKIKSPELKEMVISALKNQNRQPRGRRWTTKNKLSALAIYKRSPRAYRCLQQFIPLPNERTLQNLLKNIPMYTGINKAVLEHLKKIAAEEDSKDKICVLAFDEIALKSRLIYNQSSDMVEGYTDYGDTEERGREIADHALVFLLQGLRKKFKQPLGFYFVKGTVSSQKLATIVKNIIKVVKDAGYTVLATVCDQGPTNMGALKVLKSDPLKRDDNPNTFWVENQKVYTLYDVPHLFKSIRNNFLNNGTMVMDGKIAKWEHLKEVEEKNKSLLYLSKISSAHVQPKYKTKMRVKHAAQILSTTVSAVLKLMAQAERNEVKSQQLMHTGMLIQELDRLFDLTNGPSGPDDIKKGIRENVSCKTNHLRLWSEWRQKLQSVKFLKQSGGEARNVKCIEGYRMTLSCLQDIWHEVHKLGFKYLNLRQLNQDSLENLFGVIRQHNPTDRNPTCSSFVAALRTSVVTGLTGGNSRNSNCQKDTNKLLTNLKSYIDGFESEPQEDTEQETSNNNACYQDLASDDLTNVFHLPDSDSGVDIENNLMDVKDQPVVYVAGYLAYTLKSRMCAKCRECLLADNPDNNLYSYIKLREWWEDKQSLCYPSVPLIKTVEAAVNAFETEILPILHKPNISNMSVTLFYTCCQLLVRRQCKRINESLALREQGLNDANKRAQQQGLSNYQT